MGFSVEGSNKLLHLELLAVQITYMFHSTNPFILFLYYSQMLININPILGKDWNIIVNTPFPTCHFLTLGSYKALRTSNNTSSSFKRDWFVIPIATFVKGHFLKF